MKARVPGLRRARARRPGDRPGSALAMVAPGTEGAAGLVRGIRPSPRSAALLLVEVRDRRRRRWHAARDGRAAGGCRRRSGSANADPIRDRAERDRLPRQPPGRARPPGRRCSRASSSRLALAGRRARRPRGRDRRVPRPGGRDRGPAGRRVAVHVPTELPEAAAAVSRYHRPTRPGPAPGRDPGTARRDAAPAARPDPPRRAAGERARTGRRRRIAALLALELARDEAVRQARDDARRAIRCRRTARRGSSSWPARRRTTIRTTSPLAKPPGRELRLLASPRRLMLRGDAREPRAPDRSPRRQPDDPDGRLIAGRLAGFLQPDRRDLAAVRPRPAVARPRRRRPGRRSRRSSCSTRRHAVALAATACRPT